MNDQSAKADAGKLQLTLVPMELMESVAVVRMYGNMKYPDGGPNNWKAVNVERYRDAAFRHFAKYVTEPYGIDLESGLPHLYHLACNIAFLLSLEMESGTIPYPEEALSKMRRPEPLQACTGPGRGQGGYIYADDIKTPVRGAERG